MAFCQSILKSVDFPSSLEIISESAFEESECLELFNFPKDSKLIFIGVRAFFKTMIQKIDFPLSIEQIDDESFADCLNLQSISFSGCKNLHEVGSRAFRGCLSLPPIKFAKKVQIGEDFFLECSHHRSGSRACNII